MTKHYVVIHQAGKLPNLKDEYASEELALEALKAIAAEVEAKIRGVVVSPSGRVTFRAQDFAGAEYRKDDGPVLI